MHRLRWIRVSLERTGAFALLACILCGCQAPQGRRADPDDSRAVLASGMYRNPVYPANFPDPFVLEHQGRYYAYGTQSGEPGFQVIESADLVHWTPRGRCFTPDWADGFLWAPEVTARHGRFFLFYCARHPQTRKQDLAVAVGDSPTGPFKHGAVLMRSDPPEGERVGIIDPHVFTDVDGTDYLLYTQEKPRRIMLARLAPDFLSLVGEHVELLRPSNYFEGGVVEAPTLIRRDDRYVLLYSCGGFQGRRTDRTLYRVGHAVSAYLRGPYEKSKDYVLQSIPGQVYAPGHQCLTRYAGEDWILYHAWDARAHPRSPDHAGGRTLRLDRLYWRGVTPFVDGPSTSARAAPGTPTP